jgi:putative nucleotidyltransferase with HDIG domain
MRRAIIPFVVVVAIAAVALVVTVYLRFPIDLDGPHAWLGLATLMALTVLGDAIGVRAGRAVFSVSLIPMVTTVPLFGPSVAVLSGLVCRPLAQAIRVRREPIKWLFNVAQFTLAIGLGAVVFASLGGPYPIRDPQELDLLKLLYPLGGLIVTYFVVNMVLVGTVIALDTGKRVVDVWRHLGPVAFANDLASSWFALFVIFSFVHLQVAGLLVVLLPLFLLQHTHGLQDRLLRQNREILVFAIRTIEAKDPYTSGHSARVADLSRELAEALRLPSRRVEEVETAALLHDIGKVDFAYSQLIGSPSQLTETDREMIRSHPERGARLLESLSSMSDNVLDAVRHHHEHYDGSGYPDRLAGPEIPPAARIIMLADTVDAMLSNRPYRSAMSVEEVARELRRFSGRQFDPTLVSKFLKLGMLERAARRAEMERTPLPLAGTRPSERVASRG